MPRSRRSRASAALLLASAAAPLPGSSARAIDCGKAVTALDHAICRDKSLRAADAALGAAYAAILKATDDAEIRAMLVASQKRWLARRDDRLGHPGDGEDAPDAATQRATLITVFEARTRTLARRATGDPAQFHLIAVAREQRRFAGRFTGGPFAGFETTCDFLPSGGDLAYGCFATQSYQNRDRVSTRAEDWASGSVSETRSVGQVVDGKLRIVATCSIGAGSDASSCPDPGRPPVDGRGRWQKPAADPAGAQAPPAPPLPRLDAEIPLDPDAAWLPACLTEAMYPPPEPPSGGADAQNTASPKTASPKTALPKTASPETASPDSAARSTPLR